MAAELKVLRAGSFDPARRRQGQRRGRQRGCFVYIPAQMLQVAGIDPAGPIPFYRVWAGPRGSVVIRLYREG